jgi:hypothetical protein
MTDRELLEAAAKAAGITVSFDRTRHDWAWNPLDDDGDALRLAVRLCVRVEPSIHGCSVMWRIDQGMRVETVLSSVLGADVRAATRRAIVRAAAEIEKEMK